MKENSLAQYISKEKFKGNYSSELNEGIGDFFKKDWYNTKKHLSGNLKDDEIELYRITGDFNDKSFREAIIQKCIDTVNKKAKEAKTEETGDDKTGVTSLSNEEIDPEKVEELAQPTIQETIKKIINQVVGLARGTNSNYDPDLNPDELEKDDKLYNGGAKGYKYSWVQKDKLYIYFDSENAARRFFREDLKEQKHLEVDESVISKMFSIEKCKRSKDKVYDKVQTEKRHYKEESPIPHDTFDRECSKLIFNNIKKELIAHAKDVRYGKKVPVGRITWSWPEDEIKNFLNKCVIDGVNDVEGIKNKISDVFAEVRKAAEMAGHFLYARGTAKGNVNLNFETREDAENFKEEFESEVEYGNLSNPVDGQANSKFIEKAEAGDKEIKAVKLLSKIIVIADEQFEQIKVTEEEAAAAEAKLQKEGKNVKTFAVTVMVNKGKLNSVIEKFVKENGSDAVDSGKVLDYLNANGGDFTSLLSSIDDFCYAEPKSDGTMILHFETEYAAKNFIDQYAGKFDHAIFELSEIESNSVNSKNIEKFNDNGKKIEKNKVDSLIINSIDDEHKKYLKGLADAEREGAVAEIIIYPDMEALKPKFEEEGERFINNLVNPVGSALEEAMIHAFNRTFAPIRLSLLHEETAKPNVEEIKAAAARSKAIRATLTPEQDKVFMDLLVTYRKNPRNKGKNPTEKTMSGWAKDAMRLSSEKVKKPAAAAAKILKARGEETPVDIIKAADAEVRASGVVGTSGSAEDKKFDAKAALEKIKVSINTGINNIESLKKLIDDGKAKIADNTNGIVIRFFGMKKDDVINITKEIQNKIIAKDYIKVASSDKNYKV